MKCIVHLEFYELLTDCENCERDAFGMLLLLLLLLFKYVQSMKYCIYYQKWPREPNESECRVSP